MSVEKVKEFYGVLSQDKEMQQKFIDLNQRYQGQSMGEAAAMEIREKDLLSLAKQQGYEFSYSDLQAYGEEMKQARMNCDLSDEELALVVGGTTTEREICILIGWASGNFKGFCFYIGSFSYVVNGRTLASCGCIQAGTLSVEV